MKNPYYILISDILCRNSKNISNMGERIIREIMIFSFFECLFLFEIYYLFILITGKVPFELPILFKGSNKISSLLYLMPVFIFNLLLLSRKNKYKEIMEKYGKFRFNLGGLFYLTVACIVILEIIIFTIKNILTGKSNITNIIFCIVIICITIIFGIIILKKKKQ